jgi:hypothetical protein
MILERSQFQSRSIEELIDCNLVSIYKNKYNLDFNNLTMCMDIIMKHVNKILQYHPHIHITEDNLAPNLKFNSEIKESIFSYKMMNTLFIAWLWRKEISYITYHKFMGTKINYDSYDFFQKDKVDSYVKENGISHCSILKLAFMIFFFYENQIYPSQKTIYKVFDKIMDFELGM